MLFNFAHGHVSLQRAQTRPNPALTIEPERGFAQAGFQRHQQVGELLELKLLVKRFKCLRRRAAHRCDVFAIAFRRHVDGHPGQRSVQAQRPQVSGVLF